MPVCLTVMYNGFSSHAYLTTSGVPQGSNLGPLLFNIFINDLIKSLTCPPLAYADDLKLFSSIKSDLDVTLLQDNLNMIAKWCSANGLQLNNSKCSVITFVGKRIPNNNDYFINGHVVQRVIEARDLGVLFDNRLSFVTHIEEMCSSATRTLGFIIRSTRDFEGSQAMLSSFNSLIRSRLGYCSIVWYPNKLKSQLMIEGVQRKFLKYMSFRQDGSYPARDHLLTRHDYVLAPRRQIVFAANF